MSLRNTKPLPGDRREAVSIPNEDNQDGQPIQESDDSNTETMENSESMAGSGSSATEAATSAATEKQGSEVGAERGEAQKSDDDSDARVGEEEASKLDRNLTDSDSGNNDDIQSSGTNETQSTRVTAMFQKILALGTPSGEAAVDLGSDGEDQRFNGKPELQ